MTETLYRRPLSPDAIAFSSPEGRRLFGEALGSGGLDGYFPLAEQFHTQADPMFCGLGSLVVALNALAIDPGRPWKGAWRWFAEDLLDCCVALEEVRRRGLDLDELACVARCNGADVLLHRPTLDQLDEFRGALATAARGDAVMIASYDRGSLDQTGTGHASPVGGYHAARDLVLILDVARFKYPPHWLPTPRLLQAMQPIDPATGRPRGFLLLRPRASGVSLGFNLRCEGEDLKGLARRIASVVSEASPTASIEELARSLVPLTEHLAVRDPDTPSHQATLLAIRKLAAYPRIREAVGAPQADAVLVFLLTVADRLPPARKDEVTAIVAEAARDAALAGEIGSLQKQLGALWEVAALDHADDERSIRPAPE